MQVCVCVVAVLSSDLGQRHVRVVRRVPRELLKKAKGEVRV